MSTYYTMKARIENELDRPDLSTFVLDAIKTSIVHYENERFYFNEERAVMDTITSFEYYALPSDFQKADSMVITDQSVTYKLEPRPWSWIEAQTRTENQGRPSTFALYRNELRLWPIPDAIYEVSMGYVKHFATLSASDDTNAWMKDAERMIRSFAKAEVLVHKIRGAEAIAEATIMKQLAQEEYESLRAETDRRGQLGVLMPWGVF